MQAQFVNSFELSQGLAKFQGDTLIRFINFRSDRLPLQPYGLLLSREAGRQKYRDCYRGSWPEGNGGLYPNQGTIPAQIGGHTVE